MGDLRILFKQKYQLPITDPRFKDATDEEVILDYVLALAGKDMLDIPDDLEEDEIEWLAKVEDENDEMNMEDFLDKEMDKYFSEKTMKSIMKDE